MSRQQPRATNSVSLFPFLAVLVCAMGALIFLLLITTRRIRSEVIARAQETSPAESETDPPTGPDWEPEIVDPDAELRTKIAQLSQQRDRKQAELEKQQTVLFTAKRRANETRTAFDELKRRSWQAEVQHERHDKEKQAAQRESIELETQIAAVRQQVRQVRQAKATAPSKYALIPYDGRTGTTRRPILIECTERGIRFIPEDVLLKEEDLTGFSEAYNPLLAGARALVDYWTAPNRRVRGPDPEPEPYVLLIVRPSGSIAYYTARKLLRRLRQPSGYELLPEDWEIDLSESDPGAKATLQEAIQQVLAERKRVINAVTGDAAAGRRPAFRRNRGGGFYEEDLDRVPFGPRGSSVTRTAELPNGPNQQGSGTTDRHASESGEQRPPLPAFQPLPGGRSSSRKAGDAAEQRMWGLSGGGARIGFEREITIRVEADRVIVGRDQIIPIGDGQRKKELLDDILRAIDAYTRTWGPPPEDFYWIPSIRFLVSPGGNQHYERLYGRLSRFRISSRADFTLEPFQSPPREEPLHESSRRTD